MGRIRLNEVGAFSIYRTEVCVLDQKQFIGDVGHLLRIAVIARQYPDYLALQIFFIKKAPDLRPGKEIGMHDLIRVSAKDKLGGMYQRFQNGRQLHIGHILHFIDDHIIVSGRDFAEQVESDQIKVVIIPRSEPFQVLAEKSVHHFPFFPGDDRLLYTKFQIILFRQVGPVGNRPG